MDSNALAGPSSLPSPPRRTLSSLLLPPTQTTVSQLSGTQDLISLFSLAPSYDTYVRPYLPPPPSLSSPTASKGKEKAIEAAPKHAGQSIGFSLGGIKLGAVVSGTGGTEEGKAKKAKMEKTYSYLVSDIPGRNTIKKDHHLRDLVLNPDVQQVEILPFDEETLREAFTLKVGVIPGFDSLIWETELEMGGRKKKKKRKTDGGDEESRKKRKRKDDEGGLSP